MAETSDAAAPQRQRLHLAAEPRAVGAGHAVQAAAHVQQPQPAVLAALQEQGAREERRGGGAEVGVGRLQHALVGRRVVPLQAPCAAREPQDRVAPVRAPVEGPVARGHEQVVRPGLHDHAGAAPDRRLLGAAARRVDHRPAVGAQDVEDVADGARAAVDRDDLALVGRLVAEVAAERRVHPAAVEVQRRGELLPDRLAADDGRPRAGSGLAPVGQRQLVDAPVGRGREDEAPAAGRPPASRW